MGCRTANLTTVIDDAFVVELPVFPFSVCFCVFGWMFPAVAAVSFMIFVASICGWLISPVERWQRRAVYLLFAASNLLRGVYCSMLSAEVQHLSGHTFQSALHLSTMFIDSGIPVNALADLWAAFVDAVLAMFWLRSHKLINERKWLVISVAVGHLILAACIAIDAASLPAHKHDAQSSASEGLSIWRTTLWCIGALMTITAVAHVVSVCYLVRVSLQFGLWEITSARREIVKGIIIASVTAMCCVTRGVAIVFRQAQFWELFVFGSLSFDNPTFAATYYLVLINLPTLVTSVVFAEVYAERLRQPATAPADSARLVQSSVEYDFD